MPRSLWLSVGAFALAGLVGVAASSSAQTPQPFPKPPATPPNTSGAKPQPPAPTPAPTEAPEPPPSRSIPVAPPTPIGPPPESSLGVPLYPNAQYVGSYDAGKGQRFYLYGVAVPFAEMVAYYRTALKTRGEQLFETPGTHVFETGRYREESMGFPPSVTVKDYTFGGSLGLPNPKGGAQPTHFPTVIQIVPAPTAPPR